MILETITDDSDLLIRRMILEPDEATPWHVDRCRRFTVVIRGERLQIQFQEAGTALDVMVGRGEANWDEPDDTVHRVVNTGTSTFEEVVSFYRTTPHEDPQPSV